MKAKTQSHNWVGSDKISSPADDLNQNKKSKKAFPSQASKANAIS